jgi:hypothetical protein
MSGCSQVFSAEALLRSDHERIAELHDLRGRVREAEAKARARRTNHPRNLEGGGGFIACKFVRTLRLPPSAQYQ